MTDRGNLFRQYPAAFMKTWDGCAHLDCLTECAVQHGHCERLQRAFGAWSDISEENCPGHVASENDPKVCGLCGVHIDSLRPPEEAE